MDKLHREEAITEDIAVISLPVTQTTDRNASQITKTVHEVSEYTNEKSVSIKETTNMGVAIIVEDDIVQFVKVEPGEDIPAESDNNYNDSELKQHKDNLETNNFHCEQTTTEGIVKTVVYINETTEENMTQLIKVEPEEEIVPNNSQLPIDTETFKQDSIENATTDKLLKVEIEVTEQQSLEENPTETLYLKNNIINDGCYVKITRLDDSLLKTYLQLTKRSSRYTCKVCNANFTNTNVFKRHIFKHVIPKLYQCHQCGKQVKSKRTLIRHVQIHGKHPVETYICAVCGKCFKRKRDLDRHLVLHSGVKPHRCDTCGKGFYNRSTLIKHFRVHTAKGNKCATCGEIFGKRYELALHYVIKHTRARTHDCEICGKRFVHKSHLDMHIVRHTELRPYVCNVCGKMFKANSNLKKHCRTHTETEDVLKPFVCKPCGKRFTSECVMRRHLLIHTNLKPYKCNTCGKCFNYSGNLKKHMERHERVDSRLNNPRRKKIRVISKPYPCDKCEKRFKSKCDLQRHLTVHSDVRPYKCAKCHKRFKCTQSLEKHQQLHDDSYVKPEKCGFCDKDFRNNWDLQRHLLVHTGLKPYKCTRCSKAFTCKSNLLKHEQRHDKVTAPKAPVVTEYVCNVCGKKFRFNCDLRRHVGVHSDVRPYICAICCKGFASKRSLSRHLQRHLGGTVQTKTERKEYICECGKVFNFPSDLKRHAGSDGDAKPFVCDYCNQAFACKKNFHKHVREHEHESDKWKCMICDEEFRKKTVFRKHLSLHVVE